MAISRANGTQIRIRKLCHDPEDIANMLERCRHVMEATKKSMTVVVTCSVVTCIVVDV